MNLAVNGTLSTLWQHVWRSTYTSPRYTPHPAFTARISALILTRPGAG